MVNKKIRLKEQNQIKFQKIKFLKLLVIQNMMDTKEDWLQWFFKFFDKKSKGSGIKSMLNQQLANELHKTIIRNIF